MITMTRLLYFRIILLLCISHELKCQPYTPGGSPPPSTLSQQSYPQNTQQSYPPNTQQTYPPNQQPFSPNSQQSYPQNSQQSFQPGSQFQYPPQFQQNSQLQQTQPSNFMQPSTTQPFQYPNQQQPGFQMQQNPSFPEYPPTGQMSYPQGLSAEFLSRPNANQPQTSQGQLQTNQGQLQTNQGQLQTNQGQLQTNQGQLPNTGTQFSNPAQTGPQFTPQGQQITPYPNQPGSQFSIPGQPGAQYPNQATQYPNQAIQYPNQATQYPNQAQSTTQYPTQGQSNPQLPTQALSGTQFAVPGQPNTQSPNQVQPGTPFSGQGQAETQLSNPQASPNAVTPQGLQNTAGTTQNLTGAQTEGQNPGTPSPTELQPQQMSNEAGSQLQTQTPTGTPGQQLPGTQTSPSTTQNGQPLSQDNNAGLQFNSPETQTLANQIMKQLLGILSNPTSRDSFIFMMNHLGDTLTNPQVHKVIQTYNGQVQDKINNPNAYNNNVPAAQPQSNNIGTFTPPTITTPGSYPYHHKQEQPPPGTNSQDLASIITSAASCLADLIKFKGRILTNLLRDEVQIKSNAVSRLTGDIPVVNTLTQMGTGLADKFVGTVDRTFSPFLNSGSGGMTTMTNPNTNSQQNSQIPNQNTNTRMGNNNGMDQTYGFLNTGSGTSQTPANGTPQNGSNLANGGGFQTNVAPIGPNYQGYNEFNRQQINGRPLFTGC